MIASPGRRAEAPGSLISADAARINAIRLTGESLDALRAATASGEPASRAHILELSAEIRRLAESLRSR